MILNNIIWYTVAFIFIAIAETILVVWNVALLIGNVIYLVGTHILDIIILRVASLNT